MDFDKRDGHSYLDGVPMKISAKFIPPRPIALPIAFDAEVPADLLAEEYDFSLEKKVLESEQKRQAGLQSVQSNPTSQDVPSKIESMSNLNSTTNPGYDSILKPNSHTLPWQSNDILQPRPQQVKDATNNDAKDTSKKINLSDFENDTSSPFDYMELQTINDLEELSSVFQDLGNKPSSETIPVENDSHGEEVEPKSESISNVSKSISFPLSTLKDKEKITGSCSGSFLSGYASRSEPLPVSGSDEACSYQYASVPGREFNSFDEKKTFSSETLKFTALSQVPYISSHAVRNYTEFSDELASASRTTLRSCKSYSDIHSLSDTSAATYSQPERSLTPPTSMFTTKVTEPLIKKIAAESQNAKKIQYAESNGDLNCDNASNSYGLPDPYAELDLTSKLIVDSITDMGFSRGQVARAVKHLGVDEKKVVEHLCQIQTFEESGYDSLEAEAALHLHDYNKDEAKVFLDLVNQFQDLGFEKNAIRKALVQNKNDWNKTIDSLLT